MTLDVRAVYDSATVRQRGRTESDRRNGYAFPLKRFHNHVKRQMIHALAYESPALLDIGCGRAGDLWKWNHARVRYVYGIDACASELEEARRRYVDADAHTTTCTFALEERIAQTHVPWPRPFSHVTCMFALHYLTYADHALETAFRNVFNALEPGGVFFGIVTNGPAVVRRLETCGPDGWHTPHVRMAWTTRPRYRFSISDTVVDDETNEESLANPDALERAARRVGLEPHPLPDRMDLWELAPERPWWRPLAPPGTLPTDLYEASATYAAFAFRKPARDFDFFSV